MPFEFSEEQLALQTAIRGALSEKLSSEYLHKRFNSPVAEDAAIWKIYSDLGLAEYFSSPEAKFSDLALIALESGRALNPEPFVDTLLAGPYFWSKVTSKVDQASSEKKFGSNLSQSISAIAATAQLRFVPARPSATLLLFPTDTGMSLASLAGSTRTEEAALDRLRYQQRINLKPDSSVSLSPETSTNLRNMVSVLRAAELTGICEAVVARTVDYVKTRKQFDQPIGSFQAVQHKLADMHLDAESVSALVSFAAWAADYSKDQFALASSSALAHALEVAPRVVETAIQLHGGIGFTWEFDLHLYLRRVRAYSALYTLNQADFDQLLQLISA